MRPSLRFRRAAVDPARRTLGEALITPFGAERFTALARFPVRGACGALRNRGSKRCNLLGALRSRRPFSLAFAIKVALDKYLVSGWIGERYETDKRAGNDSARKLELRRSESTRGTEAAPTLYSLIETAKLHDVDLARYLREAVRAADRGEALLPWNLVAPAAE